jgi:hypothetical protein
VNFSLFLLTPALEETHLFAIILQQHLLRLYLLLVFLLFILHLSQYDNFGVLLVSLSQLHLLLLSTHNHEIDPLLVLCLRFFHHLSKLLQLSLVRTFQLAHFLFIILPQLSHSLVGLLLPFHLLLLVLKFYVQLPLLPLPLARL